VFTLARADPEHSEAVAAKMLLGLLQCTARGGDALGQGRASARDGGDLAIEAVDLAGEVCRRRRRG